MAGQVMQGVFSANLLGKGLEKIVEFGKKGIDLASDLEEVQNVVDVTFGDGADKIEAFAQSASSSFGLTELQAKQFSGTIGAMVKSMGLTDKAALEMSTALVGLTGDMASFYNLDHQTAFDKIRSGLSGETEPLKQLGINMSVANLEAYALSKGIKTAYDKMSEAEKVQLRYGYIMEQTTDAQGDFVRTQDSYANQVRVLQNNLDTLAANVGGLLVPALAGAVGWVNRLFAGPDTDTLQGKVADAVAALTGIEDEIIELKNNYSHTVLTVEVDYQRAQGLLEEYVRLLDGLGGGLGGRTLSLGMRGEDVADLQSQLMALGYAIDITEQVGVFGEATEKALRQYQTDMGLVEDGIAGAQTYASMSADDTERLKRVTAELVELYPQLEKYVGSNGMFREEASAVSDLVNNMRELAKQQAYQTLVSGLQTTYTQGLVNYELIGAQYDEALAKVNELQDKFNALNEVDRIWFLSKDGSLNYTQEAIDAINNYVSAFGGLENIDSARINRLGIDLAGLFDGATLKNLDTLTAEGRRFDLINLLQVIADTDVNESAVRSAYTDAQGALETAETALKDEADSLRLAAVELETAEKLYEEKFGDGSGPVVDYVAEAEAAIREQSAKTQQSLTDGIVEGADNGAKSAAANLNSLETLSLYLSAGKSAGAAYGRAFTSAARSNMSLPYGVSYASYPSHATGLDYVPYNNYLAQLHVGEAVLTASEAAKWRSGESGGGITAAQLTAAMKPVVEAVQNIKVALNIDGKTFAETTVGYNRTAINRYNTQIAKGMGK
jgi:hypothetical protein